MSFKNYLIICSIILSSVVNVFPQDKKVIVIDNGLALKICEPRTRDIFAEDPIEYELVNGNWKTPQQGESITVNDIQSKWININADDKGWLVSDELKGGYAYAEYYSDKDEIVLLEGLAYTMVYVNGVPRIGNKYKKQDTQKTYEQTYDSLIPVKLNKGKNSFLFYCTRGKLKAKLHLDEQGIFINPAAPTLPDLIVNEKPDTRGAVVVINATDKPLRNAEIIANGKCGISTTTSIPIIQPMSVRKISFTIKGNAPKVEGVINIDLKIKNNGKEIADTKTQVSLRVLKPTDNHMRTFISNIDGSTQYYSINPATDTNSAPKALFLSLHGASAKAINQSGSYFSKNWGHIVSPTNRGSYGFDWEDWGRLDALQVYDIALKTLSIDTSRIYLTGHSMGGHGTWSIGATYPDKFAAIAPSAGWISFWTYNIIPRIQNPTPMESMMMRAYLPIDTDSLLDNYKQEGIYIIHGNDDDDVPVTESMKMVKDLKKFHNDFIFHEEPGAGHWWDRSNDAGVDCVDWHPIFDYFAKHARLGKERILNVEFVTSCPGVSAKNNWVTIETQKKQLRLSKVNIEFKPDKNLFVGTSCNVARLSFDTDIVDISRPVIIELDGQTIQFNMTESNDKIWFENNNDDWSVSSEADLSMKGPHRYGLLKDAFRHNMMFVYGTKGTKEENNWAFNKARYDAEQFWYQGNGSIDIIPDVEFDSESEPDRSIIIYGNANTNCAWNKLLDDSPVKVYRDRIEIGNKKLQGNDLGCLFIRPRNGSDTASIGVISGTGTTGMKLTERRSYLTAGFEFPDLVILNKGFPVKGAEGVLAAGFFGIDWSIDFGEFVFKK